jgi:hypothetical protein
MKVIPGGRSKNLEDRRGEGGVAGRGLPIPIGGKLSLPILLILLVGMILGGVNVASNGGIGVQPGSPSQIQDDEHLVEFVSFVLDDVQATWQQTFERNGRSYQPARMVLYTSATQTGCGLGSSNVGPFYCPRDTTVYLDLGFFQELRQRFGAPGDFAQAYVIAHELGHHVQTLLGTSSQVERASQRDPSQANELSVRLELQADCLAGVWGRSTDRRGLLDPGDVEEGLAAAASVGDDRIQRQTTGRINPETWTHGSSEQRVRWFRRGFDAGSMDACDTFGPDFR